MSANRFICHRCNWNWPVHHWLPFDFSLARVAHRRHMRGHGKRPVDNGVGWCA